MVAVTEHHEPLRLSLGAYLIGALDPADRSAVAKHLDGCPACREELAELAGIPGLLGRLTADEAAALDEPRVGEQPPVLTAALHRVAVARRRRRWRWLAGAAAAVVLGIGGATAGTMVATGAGGPPAGQGTVATVAAADPVTDVRATATVHGSPSGTSVTLRLAGVAPGQHCRLVAVATDGHREIAGSWRAAYNGNVDVTGTTAIPVRDIAHLQVLTADGTHLVTLTP